MYNDKIKDFLFNSLTEKNKQILQECFKCKDFCIDEHNKNTISNLKKGHGFKVTIEVFPGFRMGGGAERY